MLVVVHAVVRVKKKGASYMTVWVVFHLLLGRTLVSGLRTKKIKKNIQKPSFLQLWLHGLIPRLLWLECPVSEATQDEL